MEDTRPVLLVTTVDIGDGQSGKIEVREGDDPVDAARDFCVRYVLPESIVGPLALHIQENIERNAEESEQQGDEGAPGAHAEPQGSPAPDSPAQPSSPTLDPYLPDDSPGASDASYAQQQQQQQVQLMQTPPALYAQPSYSPEEPADAGLAASRSRTSDAAEALLQQALARPASAPHSAVADRHAAAPRPASVNGHYGRVGSLPSSAGSGSSGRSRSSGAHNRLYADYFSKQSRLEEERRLRDLDVQLKMQQVHVTPVSQHLASHRNASGYRNYGERLYVEGRLDAMRKEKEAERVKQLEEEEALAECVFQPEISKLARALKAVDSDAGGAAWQRLYQRSQAAAKRQDRMASIKKEQEEEEVKECTFRPQINSRSQRMVQERQTILRESGIPGYEQLFNDAIRRRIKQEHMAKQAPEEATFQPRINTSSVVLRRLLERQQGGGEGAEGCGGEGAEGCGGAVLVGGDVATRLLERGRKYQQKLQHARDVLHGKVDPATGKPLYQPQTCRAPKFARNPEGQPIGEYLYAIQSERQEKLAAVVSTTQQRATAEAASTYVNRRSEKLVEKLKRERFRAVFDYLCRGEPEAAGAGGAAAGAGLNLLEVVQDETFMDTIDPEVRADIEYATKLLQRHIARRDACELQDCADSAPARGEGGTAAYAGSAAGEIDAAGFHALMEEVLQRTAGISRQYLLPMPTSRKKFDEPTFQPAIDPHSKLIAARRRPEHLPAYEVLYKTAEETEAKREEKKKVLEAARMEECVFNPKLSARQLVKEGRALKLAATLSAPRREQHGEEGSMGDPLSPAGPAAAQQQQDMEQHFDQIERQIQDALVRLSLSGEAMLAAAAQQGGPATLDGANALGASLDCTALFGSPGRVASAANGAALSSLGQYNPLDGAMGEGQQGGEGAAPPAGAERTTLEWCESDCGANDLVANIITRGEDYEGLDLHAIASASMEVPSGAFAQAAAGGAAAVVAAPALAPPSPAVSTV